MRAGLRAAVMLGPARPRPVPPLHDYRTGMPPGSTYARAGAATGLTQASALVDFAADVAPITDRGLLIEPARTNLFPAAAVTTDGAWAATSGIKTANAGVAPDGTSRAALYSNSSTSGRMRSGSITTAIASVYAGSIFVKNVDAVQSQLSIYDGVSAFAARLNLHWTGAVLSSLTTAANPPIGYGSIDLGGGWYLVWLTAAATATSEQLMFYVDQTFSGRSVLLWGAQFELGASPSSPILTTGATAPRNLPVIIEPVPAYRTRALLRFADDDSLLIPGLTPGGTLDVAAAVITDGKGRFGASELISREWQW